MPRAYRYTVGSQHVPKVLVKYGQDIPTTSQFAANTSLYESRPFDGWVIQSAHTANWWSGTAITQAAWASEIATFPSGLTQNTHNYWRLNCELYSSQDWFDDTLWTTITSNVGNLAAALAASGRQFDGIFFDDEAYGTYNPMDFGATTTAWAYSATLGATPGKTAVQARDQAILRGKQVMDAAATAWPAVKVISAHGITTSESFTFSTLTWENDTAWNNELTGAFDYGLCRSTFTNTSATWMDGAEVAYEIRDQARADTTRAWVKTGWANGSTFLLPSGEGASYKAAMRYAPGMYDKDFFNGYALHTAANLQTYLTLSLASSDGVGWLYTEWHEWGASASGKPAVTQAYLDAVSAAKAAA